MGDARQMTWEGNRYRLHHRSGLGHRIHKFERQKFLSGCQQILQKEGFVRRVFFSARAAAWAGLALLFFVLRAHAHGIAGKRMFIEPLVTEDANVKNELVLPSGGFQVQADGTWRELGFSFEKALYPRRLSIVVEGGRIYQHTDAEKLAGWGNLEMGLKWQGFTSERHEFVLGPALFATFPTGSTQVAPHQTSLRPMLLYAKGFGDLSIGWLRPFAVQGDVGYEASVSGPRDRQLVFNEVLTYSIPYLDHWVRQADAGYSMEHSLRRGLSRGAVFGNLFPFVEFNGARELNGAPGAASFELRPGVLWMGKYLQVSMAANIPVQSPGMEHPHTGASVQVDWFLDEIIPPFTWTPFGRHPHGH
jgi:hypothetical protein